MVKKLLEQVIKETQSYGFSNDLIQIAYKNVDGDSDKIIEQILRMLQESNQYTTKPVNANDQDAQLSKAIQMSINEAKGKKISLQPLNPEQRLRKAGVPVGLKNIGNTCYFNSLLQTYFQNVEFVKTVLAYSTPERYQKDKKPMDNQDAIQFKRKQCSCKLVQNMKILFSNMIASDRKYMDPTDVVTSVVDDNGNQIPIGDQKDIGQFNLIFFSRIDQGLELSKRKKSIQKQSQIDSSSKISVFGQDLKDQVPSMMPRSSIKIQLNSIINQQFFGSMENTYINQQHNINQSQEQLFNLLIVNVKHKQLYRSLEQITLQHVDEFRNEKGQIVGVQKQSWIKKAPKTLLFQINRVLFDKETKQLQKINDEFDFPQTFYIDPFLLKNKGTALALQKRVRKLREQRQKYTNALKQFMKFGQKNMDLIDAFVTTRHFFEQQNTQMNLEDQLEYPILFPKLKSKIKPQHIALLKLYQQSIQKKINLYHSKIQTIDKQIQSCYSQIKSSPYHLYSILIHQGNADSGHYYSYTFDIRTKGWRKYNDINISDQTKQQVMKEAKGLNSTSAYYLVYSQQRVLTPTHNPLNLQLRNYEISSGSAYLKDYYSSMVPSDLKNKIAQQNQKLYRQIQQYKMSAYANRVVDNYVKKFQTCNSAFRKIKDGKTEKKTKNPPFLVNLPLFFKNQNQDELYKSSLLYSAINQYGPKEENIIFNEILENKLKNFNEFKKPKTIDFDYPTHLKNYMNKIYKTKSVTKLFQALKHQQYSGIFSLVKQLKSEPQSQYFDWITNLIIKILVVSFLNQAQLLAQNHKQQQALGKLKLMLVFCLHFINRQEENSLINNCIFWVGQISIFLTEQHKKETQKISQLLFQSGRTSPYDAIIATNDKAHKIIEQIKNSIDVEDALWNLSRSENIEVAKLEAAKEAVKSKMEVANQIYKEIKKSSLPLNKEERHQIMKKLAK